MKDENFYSWAGDSMKKIIFIILLFNSIFHSVNAQYKTHELQKDETIWRLSKKYDVSVDEICRLNGISDVTAVKYGTVLKIPEKSKNENTTNYIIHILKKNETIWRLSKKYNTTVEKICTLNNIKDISNIKIGAKIKIPVNYEYLDYDLPINGQVKTFTSAHFRGIYIFTNSINDNRNVYTIDNGEVSYIDNIPGFGLTIFIRHINGLVSTYSGLEKTFVKKGAILKKGQLIGTAGKSSRFKNYGILFSIQYKGNGLIFDSQRKKFLKK